MEVSELLQLYKGWSHLQLQVGWDPRRLDRRDVCSNNFRVGELVGKITVLTSIKGSVQGEVMLLYIAQIPEYSTLLVIYVFVICSRVT